MINKNFYTEIPEFLATFVNEKGYILHFTDNFHRDDF